MIKNLVSGEISVQMRQIFFGLEKIDFVLTIWQASTVTTFFRRTKATMVEYAGTKMAIF
jgi:hypothetical protein